MAYWDVSLVLDNKVGALADLGEAFGKAGVNLEGLWTHDRDGETHVHVLVANLETTEKLAGEKGWKIHKSHEVLVAPVENRPGWLGAQCRKLAQANINIEWCYLATDNRVVVSVKDLAKAREVWQAVGSAAN